MEKEITKQDKEFVDIYAETGNGTQAAKEAYGIQDANYAGVKANRMLRNDKIQEALEEALPTELLNQVHREGLFATKPIYTEEGELVSEDADFNARHKYLDTAYKLKGSYAPEKRVTLTIDGELEPIERAYATKLLEQQKSA